MGPAPCSAIRSRSRDTSWSLNARSASGATYTGLVRSSCAVWLSTPCALAGAATASVAASTDRRTRRRIGSGLPARTPDAEPPPGRVRDRVAVRLDGQALAPLRRRLLVALPDLRPGRVRG